MMIVKVTQEVLFFMHGVTEKIITCPWQKYEMWHL